MSSRSIRVGNFSGFFGDRGSALREMVLNAEADVLTGDYLAEVTMRILSKLRDRDPAAGYASSFLPQLQAALKPLAESETRIVVNAGGLNPQGLADAVTQLCCESGIDLPVAAVLGDDLMTDPTLLQELDVDFEPQTANAYLGGWGIAEALRAGARIVVTGRVADASLIVGPAAWWHGWGREDYDALAGAVVAGHVIECGTQATGGNFSGYRSIALSDIAFPVATIAADGSSIISKPEPSGGLVSVNTVTAQLLYEIQGRYYANADVITDLASMSLEEIAPNQVSITRTRGLPPPSTTKVAVTGDGPWVNELMLGVTGREFEHKRAAVEAELQRRFGGDERITALRAELLGSEVADPTTQNAATGFIRVVVHGTDERAVGRPFANALVEMALANYPGLFAITPPGKATRAGRYESRYVDQARLDHRTVGPEPDHTAQIQPPATTAPYELVFEEQESRATTAPDAPCLRVPLGDLVHARSGDKGEDANLGVWVETDEAFEWLCSWLTRERLATELLPEAADLEVHRLVLPNLRAINFVIAGLLEGGAIASLRLDSQAKGLGEFLRSRHADIPRHLIEN